ncbi:hypothetical protein [Haladaptatus sp. NG-SE-30]
MTRERHGRQEAGGDLAPQRPLLPMPDESAVSRKLRQMEADGEITRVQIGQGNVVFLNGSEPKATKSLFDV